MHSYAQGHRLRYFISPQFTLTSCSNCNIMDPYQRNDTYEARLGRANWDRGYTNPTPSQPLILEDEIEALMEELSSTSDREAFNLVMSRFDSNFIGRFKTKYPAQAGLFPHGSGARQAPAPPAMQQPYSYLGSLYQSPSRPQSVPPPDAFAQSRHNEYLPKQFGFEAPQDYNRGRPDPSYTGTSASYGPSHGNYQPSAGYQPTPFHQTSSYQPHSQLAHSQYGPAVQQPPYGYSMGQYNPMDSQYSSMAPQYNTVQPQFSGYREPMPSTRQVPVTLRTPSRDHHPKPTQEASHDYLKESKEQRQMKEDLLKNFGQAGYSQPMPSQATRALY